MEMDIGPTLRKNDNNGTKQALDRNQQGHCKKGGRKNTRRRGLTSDSKMIGTTWKEAKSAQKTGRGGKTL